MTPSSGREECAARPRISTSIAANPRWATITSSHVGSPTMQASGSLPARCSSTAAVPRLACSSSATSARTTSPSCPASAASLGGDDHGRHARLHVAGAAPVQPVALDARRERFLHALDPDRVEVPVERQRPSAAATAMGRDQARPRGRPDDLDLESPPARAVRPAAPPRDLRPAAPGTSAGLTVSSATSSRVSSTASSDTGYLRLAATVIEPEHVVVPIAARAPTSLRDRSLPVKR